MGLSAHFTILWYQDLGNYMQGNLFGNHIMVPAVFEGGWGINAFFHKNHYDIPFNVFCIGFNG